MHVDPIVYAIPVFIVTLLAEAVAARLMGRPLYDLADAVTSLNLGVLSRIAPMLLGGAAVGAIYLGVFNSFRIGAWPMGSPIAWLAALVLYDLAYYWNHRFNHEIGVMWASHVVHHSSEYYNLTTALRQTSTGFLFGWLTILPLAVLGVPPVMMGAVGLINLLYQYWVHTELIGRLGVLDYVLVTPSNHRVHHGQNDYCIDRNYGGMFIFWDMLFGSFADERPDEPITYGVRRALGSYNPVWGNLHVYADLWREAKKARDLPGWIGAWLAPPQGWTDGPIDHFDAAGFRRLASPAAPALRWYALVQLSVGIALLTAFLIVRDSLTGVETAAVAVLVVGGMISQGGLLENRPWAVWLEAARLAGAGAFALASPTLLGLAAPAPVRLAVALAAAAALAWLVRARGGAASARGPSPEGLAR